MGLMELSGPSLQLFCKSKSIPKEKIFIKGNKNTRRAKRNRPVSRVSPQATVCKLYFQ